MPKAVAAAFDHNNNNNSVSLLQEAEVSAALGIMQQLAPDLVVDQKAEVEPILALLLLLLIVMKNENAHPVDSDLFLAVVITHHHPKSSSSSHWKISHGKSRVAAHGLQ